MFARILAFLKRFWWAILLAIILVIFLVWAFGSNSEKKATSPIVPTTTLSVARASMSSAQKAADVAARISVLEDKKDALEKASGDNGKLEELIRVNEQLLELYAERTGLMIADAKIARSANAIKELNLAMVACAKDVPCMLAAKAKADAAREAMNTPAPKVSAPAPAVVAPAVTSPAPSAAKLPQAQKPKPSPASNQPQAGTRGSGWEKPANESVQWSATQGGLSDGINVQTGPCFKLPPGFTPSHAARAAGLNECH